MTTVAMDIDLQKIYAVSSDGDILAKSSPLRAATLNAVRSASPELVLIEVASPILYMNDNVNWKEAKGQVINRLRWALWNIAAAEYLTANLELTGSRVLVAPSHRWTMGHDLKMRHDVAGCKQKQKDLRECEAMIFYHHHNPNNWVPLDQYLTEI